MADIYSILAGKGRGEDEHIRKVFGEPSHVNEVEKDAIDVYGLLGEIFTKEVGTGDTNPNTGLPEYDWKYRYNWEGKKVKKKSKGSPHNRSHRKFKKTGGASGKNHQHKTGAEVRIESQEQQTKAEGAALLDPEQNLDPETGEPLTAGAMNLGQTVLKAEDYKGMTPEAIVNDIFAKQYNNQVPPGKGTEAEFKEYLAGLLNKMPQFGEADEKKMGFLSETKDLAVEQASITAQTGARQVGGAQRSAYGGMGTGVRTGVSAGTGLAQTYGLGLETADLGFRAGAYGLEQEADTAWESGFTDFLGTLPAAA